MKKIDTNKLINAETVLSSKYGVPGSDSRRMFEEKAHAYYYGVILRDRRKELKMTQSELAQKAGVTQRLVSDFERGKVDIQVDTLCRLFIALDLCLSGIDERLACENEDPPEW